MTMGKRKREETESKKERKIRKLLRKFKRLVSESDHETEGSNEDQEHPVPTVMEGSLQENVLVETESIPVSEELLSLLGTTETVKEGFSIHPELSTRWSPIITKGLTKEVIDDLLKEYLPLKNLPTMIPPKLNPEIESAVSESIKKRDSIIENRQQHISASLSALGKALHFSLTKDPDSSVIVKCLHDASKILCNVFHLDTKSRRGLLMAATNKDLKNSLSGEPDTFLFGSNLSERIKTAKAVQRSSQELKNPVQVQPSPRPTAAPKTLNWRGPPRTPSYRNAGGKPNQSKKQTTKVAVDRKYKQQTRKRWQN